MLRWILKILKDERGIVSNIFSYLGSRQRGKPPQVAEFQWPNVGELQRGLSGDLLGKIGQPSQYEYNPAFTTMQPEVEKAVESTVLGKLGNLPKMRGDIQDIHQRYYGAQKEQMQERFGEEQEAQKNMYNRLGLASSTPGLAASTTLGRKQEQELGVLSADIARQGIDQEMRATELAEQIINQYMTQGQVLGQAQRGYEQFAQQMSMQDIIRMAEENNMTVSQIMQYLGQGAVSPEQQYTSKLFGWQQPTGWDWAASGMRSMGDINVGDLLSSILGKDGTMGNTGKTQSQILGANTRQWR